MTHLALLRGINVGGGNRVPMASLRESIRATGMTDVSTYINSGNVLFTAQEGADPAGLAAGIEAQLAQDFGFAITVLVLPGATLETIARAIPADWTNDANIKSDVLFLLPELHGPEALAHFPLRAGVDEAIYESGAVIWRVDRKDQPRSGLLSIVGTPLYRRCTVRNVNTVRKLATLIEARSATGRTQPPPAASR